MVIIFDKSLRITSAEKDKITTGEIVNLMSVDAAKVDNQLQYYKSWNWGITLTIVLFCQ